MTEISFAKSFLQTLDSKPIKLSADHAIDPKMLQLNHAYTLPRQPPPHPAMKKKTSSTGTAPGSAPSISITLRSLRNPPIDLTLTNKPLTSSVFELKAEVARTLSIDVSSVRILFRKRPCSDSKTVKEILGADAQREKSVEFAVMIIGGEAVVPKQSSDGDVVMGEADGSVVAQGESGASVLAAQEFWTDLAAFLKQRIRDVGVADQAARVFEQAWKSRS